MPSSQTALHNGAGLSEARRKLIEEQLAQLRIYQRRAARTGSPEDRVALAEFENEILEILKRWQQAGLISSQTELALAAEAPVRR